MNDPIQAEVAGPVTIVTFRDSVITDPDRVEAIREALDRLFESGHRNLLFDLGGVELIGSSMLGMLLGLKKRINDYLPPGRQRPSRRFEMYPDRESALHELGESGTAEGWFALCDITPDLLGVFILN